VPEQIDFVIRDEMRMVKMATISGSAPGSCSLIHSRSLIFAISNGMASCFGRGDRAVACADYRIRTLTRNANEGARRCVDHAVNASLVCFPSAIEPPLVCRRDPVRLRWTGDCS